MLSGNKHFYLSGIKIVNNLQSYDESFAELYKTSNYFIPAWHAGGTRPYPPPAGDIVGSDPRSGRNTARSACPALNPE